MDEKQKKLFRDFLEQQKKDGLISQSEYDDSLSKLRNQSTLKTTKTNNSGGGVSDLVSGVGDLLSAGERQEIAPESVTSISEIVGKLFAKDSSGGMSVTGLLSNIAGMAADAAETTIKETSFALTELNEKVGLTGKLSGDFRDSIREVQPDLAAIDISFGEVVKAAGRLVDEQGRFALVGGDILLKAGEVSKAYGIDYRDMVGSFAQFEKVGIGASEASQAIGEAGKGSLELGLQSKKVIEGLTDNLGKLNQFGFQDGVKGLERMVQKSIEFRMNLENVFTVANKVFDPEGALDLAANLQVVGGAIGAFNDPLQLMYMATNNVEGLQDALIQAAEGLATYNDETGGFEVTGVNLRKARDMAQAFGVDLKDVTQAAIATEERLSAMSSLDGLSIDEKNKEFLTNIARMKDGKMSIDLQGEELQNFFGKKTVELGELSEAQAKKLLEYQDEFKELSDTDIVRNQATAVENIKRDVNSLVTLARIQAGQVIDKAGQKIAGMDTKEMGKWLSENSQEIRKGVSDKIKEGSDYVKNDLLGDGNKNTTSSANSQTSTNSTVTVNLRSDNVTAGLQKEILQNPSSWSDLITPGSRDYTVTSYEIK